MALLIYKQWHRQPNKKSTAPNNAAHIAYIGYRVHALKDEGKENALFGKVQGEFQTDLDMQAITAYVNKISRAGKTVFRSAISFKPETAEALGLTDKRNWESFAKYHVDAIARENNIRTQDFEYLAAVHDKKGQPHIHISL